MRTLILGGARSGKSRLAERLAAGGGPTIICAQAGEVNTGAFDDLDDIADAAAETQAWVHIDGAFGLWAAASPALRHLVQGAGRALRRAVSASVAAAGRGSRRRGRIHERRAVEVEHVEQRVGVGVARSERGHPEQAERLLGARSLAEGARRTLRRSRIGERYVSRDSP